MPITNSGKSPQTVSDYSAARASDRFFCEVKTRAAGIRELAEAECFTLVCDAVKLLADEVVVELDRRSDERVKQLELEGLLTLENRAAANQGVFL